jgi:hypothetical protein
MGLVGQLQLQELKLLQNSSFILLAITVVEALQSFLQQLISSSLDFIPPF